MNNSDCLMASRETYSSQSFIVCTDNGHLQQRLCDESYTSGVIEAFVS